MNRKTILLGSALLGMLLVFASGLRLSQAEEIRLEDGTEFSGTILGRTGVNVIVGIDRALVKAIDGEELPAPVVISGRLLHLKRFAPSGRQLFLRAITKIHAPVVLQPVKTFFVNF